MVVVVAVTWQHVAGKALIYANGKKMGYGTYSPGETFYAPTGKLYMIGNDNHMTSHQFHGAVMDLYVFGTALSLDEINELRGERFVVPICPITLGDSSETTTENTVKVQGIISNLCLCLYLYSIYLFVFV